MLSDKELSSIPRNRDFCTRSVLAVAAQFLPGDWGFFVPYLTGGKGTYASVSCMCKTLRAMRTVSLPVLITGACAGISIAVLAIGSTAPGLLQFFIGK